jgi:hypothetical protein
MQHSIVIPLTFSVETFSDDPACNRVYTSRTPTYGADSFAGPSGHNGKCAAVARIVTFAEVPPEAVTMAQIQA